MERLMMVLVLAAAMLTGCDEGKVAKESQASVPRGELTYETMASNDVIVVVNGKSLTKGAVEREIAVQAELFKLGKPRAKISDLERAKARMRRSAEKRFIERRVMVEEAMRRGFTVSDEDRQKIRERMAKTVLRGGRARYGILAGKLSAEQRAELDAGLDLDMLCQKANAALMKECRVAVTDDDARKKFQELEAYNARARLEETEIWRSASNVWDRIQGGRDFEGEAEKCAHGNDHINCDMNWGEFDVDFFKGDTNLCHYLTVMPVGTVTPPVTGDNGLLIVKMLEKLPVDFGAGQVKPRYRLAKIFFELPETYPLTTVDALKAEMVSAKSAEAFKARIATLKAAARLEYPNGKIAMAARQPPRLRQTGGKNVLKQSSEDASEKTSRKEKSK